MTETNIDSELFTAEFRHEQVIRFIRGLIEGSMKIQPSSNQAVIQSIAELITDLTRYVSGKLKGEELDAMEQKLFQWLAVLKITNALDEGITSTHVEREIKALHLRIDSTNMLLLEVMTILKEFMKSFDKEK
jgi:hypothetical protein